MARHVLKAIYMVVPAHVYTGGPTALFQLCHYLNKHFGIDARIAFINIREEGNPIHPCYKKFECQWLPLKKVKDDPGNIIIFPETLTNLVDKFRFSKKVIYWLAVDNFFLSRYPTSKISKFLFLVRTFPNILRFLYIPDKRILLWNDYKQYIAYDEIVKVMENGALQEFLSKIDLHIAQSIYARNFLIKLGVDKERIPILREPLEEEFLNAKINYDKKEDIVAFNARKAFSIVDRILSKLKKRNKTLKIIPLMNVGKEGMIKTLGKSKVFVDIGLHPGRDRPPREAAVLGNIVIVNRRGGCYFFEDCPIPGEYKIYCRDLACRDLNINNTVNLIEDCLENYHQHINKFQEFREYVKNEVNLYLKDLENLLALIEEL